MIRYFYHFKREYTLDVSAPSNSLKERLDTSLKGNWCILARVVTGVLLSSFGRGSSAVGTTQPSRFSLGQRRTSSWAASIAWSPQLIRRSKHSSGRSHVAKHDVLEVQEAEMAAMLQAKLQVLLLGGSDVLAHTTELRAELQSTASHNKAQLAASLRGVEMLQGPDGADPKLLAMSKLHMVGEVLGALFERLQKRDAKQARAHTRMGGGSLMTWD